MNTISQGRLGEVKIATHFVEHGYDVYMPTFGNGECDMIVSRHGEFFRVEVKCGGFSRRDGKYEIQLKSVRPNRTKNTIKMFDAANSDYLAIYCPPLDKVVVLPSVAYHGKGQLTISEHSTSLIDLHPTVTPDI